MRFLLDENIPYRLRYRLLEEGHECEHIYDKGWGGKADEEIAEWASLNKVVLLTCDDDFRFIWQEFDDLCVVLFKVKPTSFEVIARAFQRVNSQVAKKRFRNSLITVNSAAIKVRSRRTR